MSYGLNMSPQAERSLRQYIASYRPEARPVILTVIADHLQRLARNPRLGSTPRGAFGRPIYRIPPFSIDGIQRVLEIVYFYEQDEKNLGILYVGPLRM
jgi:hypothetical protein